MGKWAEATLGELYEFASGLSKPRSEFGSGFPFLSFKDVFYNSFVPSTLTSLVKSDEQERERCSIKRGDVFLTRTSETMDELGMSCVALCDVPDGTFNGFTKRLRPKLSSAIIPEYAGYYFRSQFFRSSVNAMTTMSTRASLNNEMLARLRMFLPPVKSQEAIGATLKSLDDKIELNRRMNETLEAMARAIFKDWFVDFGPTRAKAEGRAPYLAPDIWSLFPARLDADGKPEGWQTEPLGAHMSNFDSKRVPVSGAERAKRQGPFPYHGATGVMDHVDAYLFDGIYLLVGEDGSVVKENGLAFTQYVWGKIWVNNHAHVLQGRGSVSTEQLLLYFQNEVVTPYITGAVQLKLSQGRMNAMPFIYAGACVCEAFAALVAPIFAKYRANADESKMLAATRDLLLPKLMSGEVRVKSAETIVGKVV